MRRAIICDIDGVLADSAWRETVDISDLVQCGITSPAVLSAYFSTLYAKSIHDKVMRQGLDSVAYWLEQATGPGSPSALLLLTGRHEEAREVTLKWLARHMAFLFKDTKTKELSDTVRLVMRPGCQGKLLPAKFKEVVYEKQLKRIFDVVLALDDDPDVIRMYHRIGVPAFLCKKGVFPISNITVKKIPASKPKLISAYEKASQLGDMSHSVH